ncbi:uncharacterized protein LOC130448431 [Diorhabda sublineata]|uniref:uncharacterized protein LOC130448431 n=1 Tax=Diorhabda sublineata TaxID=1163346 RepID=UPI0024E14470|nr:uncharacterized protein LOC130448431 [Diorhabda sublineata]
MTSTNEHLPQPPKQRISPLEFRNTDLVSRLLAATPPYLYNMSLLPNTYFFSEMLRSFVQAKAERSQSFHPPIRRSRKRNWTTSRTECFLKPPNESKSEEVVQQDNSIDWMLKSNKKTEENPLELTMNKDVTEYFQNKTENFNKIEQNNPEVYSNMHHNISQDNPQNLVLPPPPPMWYPPLYPAPPYGIDPLHFFIDLRVSGHIYDKKNNKDNETLTSENSSKDKIPHTEVSNFDSESITSSFKQTRNCSAFSVPVPSGSKSTNPINLSEKETKSTKFDVKSMGFDKTTNKTSTNYVMSNITNIYKNINGSRNDNIEIKEENEEKKVRDLRAVIGLELVVDYMKQKPEKHTNDESSVSSDIESVGSPTLEVVDEN